MTPETPETSSRFLPILSRKFKECADALPNLLALLEAGVPIPFIARYRKDRTHGMTEARIREVRDELQELSEVETLRRKAQKEVEANGRLSDDHRTIALRSIERAESRSELREALAFVNRELTPDDQVVQERYGALATAIEKGDSDLPIEDLAAPFVTGRVGVLALETAIGGAVRALALRFAADLETRERMKKFSIQRARIVSKVFPGKDSLKKYETYHDFSQPARALPSHRVLAILRGRAEKALTVQVEIPREEALERLEKRLLPPEDHPFRSLVKAAICVAWDDILKGEMGRAVLDAVKEKADADSIRIFARNLQQLLLLPPAGPVVVMGIEPGVRRGCKIAVVGAGGEFLGHASIYPFPPRSKTEAAKKTVGDFCRQHKVELIGIGSGPGCREVERFVRQLLQEDEGLSARMAMVNEAGAAAYSTSGTGKAEFPKLDPRVRSAVSIARRLRDPIAELVKVEPGAISVGPYQRDVDQRRLRQALADVIESAVARVCVDVNQVGPELLRYVPGLDRKRAEAIAAYRAEHGPIRSREQLKEVPGLDEKAWHFAAGFVRIENGENPLDGTRIHPESYEIAESMAEKLGIETGELLGNERALAGLDPEGFTNDEWPSTTVAHVFDEIRSPGRDPRGVFEPPEFRADLESMSDLKPGMTLEGLVTNIASFGAFVDVGVDQEGLIHVSELSDRFVEDPGAVVSVGAKVKVRVIGVEPERKRLSLSMRTPGSKKRHRSSRGGSGKPGERQRGRQGRRLDREDGRRGGAQKGRGRSSGKGGGGKGGRRRERRGERRPARRGGDSRPPRVIEQKGRREPEPKIDPNLPEDEIYRLKLERLRDKFEKGR